MLYFLLKNGSVATAVLTTMYSHPWASTGINSQVPYLKQHSTIPSVFTFDD